MRGHSANILAVDAITVSRPDYATFLASASRHHTTRVWRKCVNEIQESGTNCRCIASADRTLNMWPLDNVRIAAQKADRTKIGVDCNKDSDMPDRNESDDDDLVYDVLDATVNNDGHKLSKLRVDWTVLAQEKNINAAAVSPDGQLIATGSQTVECCVLAGG